MMNNEELYIQAEIVDLLNDLAPPGAGITINGDRIFTVEIVCPKENRAMGYHCCFRPGHRGLCYSENKAVFFNPDL